MCSSLTMRSAFFCLSPSIVRRSMVNWSLFPMENFSNRAIPSLQLGHQVAQNTNKTGFPLKSLRETVFPSSPFREKGGASTLGGNPWTPKEAQEGQSVGAARSSPARMVEMEQIPTPDTINRKEKRVFFVMTIPESVSGRDSTSRPPSTVSAWGYTKYHSIKQGIILKTASKIRYILNLVNICLKRDFGRGKLTCRFKT